MPPVMEKLRGDGAPNRLKRAEATMRAHVFNCMKTIRRMMGRWTVEGQSGRCARTLAGGGRAVKVKRLVEG